MAEKTPKSANDNGNLIRQLNQWFQRAQRIIGNRSLDDTVANHQLQELWDGLTPELATSLLHHRYKGLSLLHHCMTKQRYLCAYTLLEKRAKSTLASTHRTTLGDTPLHFACLEMDLGMVQQMLTLDGENVFTLNRHDQSPLHIACYMHEPLIALVFLKHLKEATPLAHQMEIINQPDYQGNTPLHYAMMHGRESVAMRLIELGARKDLKNKAGQTPFQACYNNIEVRHMAEAFIAHVVLPALVLETGKDKNNLIGYKPETVRHIVEELTPDVLKALCETGTPYNLKPEENDAVFFRPLRLVRTWQHPPIDFPADLIKINHTRSWKPLLPEGFRASNGLTIKSLTSYNDLMDDSKALRHCVGTSAMYVQRCCETKPDSRIHILSLQKNGEHASTVDFRLSSYRHYSGAQQSIQVPGTRPAQFLHVIMHRGKDNCILGKDSPEHQALQEFLSAVKEKKFLKQGNHPPEFTLQTDQNKLGETSFSRQKISQHDVFARFCGYTPTPEALEKCFYEYKETDRAASSGKHGNDTLKYDKVVLKESSTAGMDYEADSHFIDGTTQNNIRYRYMNVQGWLKATGLMERIHEVIKQEFPMAPKAQAATWAQQAAAPITESSPPPTKKPSQHNDIQARIERTSGSFVDRVGAGNNIVKLRS